MSLRARTTLREEMNKAAQENAASDSTALSRTTTFFELLTSRSQNSKGEIHVDTNNTLIDGTNSARIDAFCAFLQEQGVPVTIISGESNKLKKLAQNGVQTAAWQVEHKPNASVETKTLGTTPIALLIDDDADDCSRFYEKQNLLGGHLDPNSELMTQILDDWDALSEEEKITAIKPLINLGESSPTSTPGYHSSPGSHLT